MRSLLSLAVAAAVALPAGAQTTCTFTPTGQSCGPQLSGSEKVEDSTHIVTLVVTDAPVTAPGLLVLGVQPLAFQFPGTTCFLHLNPLLALPVSSDANGRMTRTFARHKDLVGTVLVQTGFEDLKQNQPLETSNALKIVCQ